EPGRGQPPPGWTLQGAPAPLLPLVRGAEPGGDLGAAATAVIDLFDHPSRTDRSARIALGNALDQIGKLALARGDLPTAEASFTAAIAAAPSMARPHVNRAVARARRGDVAGAAADTEDASALDPGHVTARINAARFYIQLGDDARARAHIERARALAPGRAAPWAITAVLDARAGDFTAARTHADRALALDPTDRDAVSADTQLRHSGH
ncbi:MAG TPA: tetratricopeptide repeat protein, partial [Kofleriaceae bacterium]|nr:tetratricopeptide repeat protein [Kofleriaceae bacterium]